MQASLSAFRFNRSAMFYLGLFALLAFMMLALLSLPKAPAVRCLMKAG